MIDGLLAIGAAQHLKTMAFQLGGQHVANIGVIFRQQNGAALAVQWTEHILIIHQPMHRQFIFARQRHGQRQHKGGAVAGAAAHGDARVHALGPLRGNCQAQAQAWRAPGGGQAFEGLENPRLVFQRNAGAGVADIELDLGKARFGLAAADGQADGAVMVNLAALASRFCKICCKRLASTLTMAGRLRIHQKTVALPAGQGFRLGRHRVDQGVQIHRRGVQRVALRGAARVVDQIVNQRQQVVGAAADDAAAASARPAA